MSDETRTCRTCKKVKQLKEFGGRNNSRVTCSDCRVAHSKQKAMRDRYVDRMMSGLGLTDADY